MKSNSMKKLIICLLVFLIIVFIIIFFVIPFSLRTISTRGPIPYGVWQSEEPNITLYFDPEIWVSDPFSGIYVKDGESTDIVIIFSTANKGFRIYDKEVYFNENRISENTLYAGDYRVRGNKLRYSLRPYWREWAECIRKQPHQTKINVIDSQQTVMYAKTSTQLHTRLLLYFGSKLIQH